MKSTKNKILISLAIFIALIISSGVGLFFNDYKNVYAEESYFMAVEKYCLPVKNNIPDIEKIIDEYKDVLCRPKFRLPNQLVYAITEQMKSTGLFLDRTQSNEIFPDPKDVVFYEVALSKKDSFLVTGNIKHFPKNPIVVSPAEMMRLIEESK